MGLSFLWKPATHRGGFMTTLFDILKDFAKDVEEIVSEDGYTEEDIDALIKQYLGE